MFKRFLVMDVFCEVPKIEDVKEWVDVNQELPKKKTAYMVKLSNSDIVQAYFCLDQCINLMTSKSLMDGTVLKLTYWFKRGNGQPLYNVTHWGKI